MNGTRLLGAISALVLARRSQPQRNPRFRSEPEQADKILVEIGAQALSVEGRACAHEFDISLGLVPVGPKQREGDFRTPEGVYYLESRNVRQRLFPVDQGVVSECDRIVRARTRKAWTRAGKS